LANFFRKIFSTHKPAVTASVDIPTKPVQLEETPPVESSQPDEIQLPTLDLPQFNAGCAQSVGKQRQHNEDSLFMLNTMLAANGTQLPLGLFVIADGMGGHKQGEVASGLAVRTLANQILRKVFMCLLATHPTPPEESMQEILETSLQEAHRTVMKEAPGSGTTVTGVLVVDKQMTIAHIGDSRAYAVSPEGELKVLTRDHSLVMRMMEMGQLTEEEAAIHPQRNVLYRALGQGDTFAPEITTLPLPESGYLLLCSDGLWGVVEHKAMSKLITSAPDPQVACQLLIDAANTAGGPDNISAILVQLPGSTA
jgi:PPM family protein phosphatase